MGYPNPSFYFATGTGDADHYRSPLSRMADQVKLFQMYMEDIDKTYKIENIDRIIVKGYASGLDDAGPNIDLSGNRARYAKKLFSRLNIIIPVKVEPKGERIDAPDNEDKPTDRRAELYVRIKGIARP